MLERKKAIVGTIILIVGVILIWSIVIPLYYVNYGNINVIKYDTCDNIINVTDDLEKYPALKKVLNGDQCYGTVCKITQNEWNEIKNFIESKRNNPGECIKFENYDGVYKINFIRP